MKWKVCKFILTVFVLLVLTNAILNQMVFVTRVTAVSADLPAAFAG